jgi:hypothetical protein
MRKEERTSQVRVYGQEGVTFQQWIGMSPLCAIILSVKKKEDKRIEQLDLF